MRPCEGGAVSPLRQSGVNGKLCLPNGEDFTMSGWMNGGNWIWMSFMMVFWLVALCAIVYAAVRLGSRSSCDKRR